MKQGNERKIKQGKLKCVRKNGTKKIQETGKMTHGNEEK